MREQGQTARPAVPAFPHRRLFQGDPARLPAGTRVAIVVSRYNPRVTEAMLDGAAAVLRDAGIDTTSPTGRRRRIAPGRS